jgi:hypothetical protein
MGIAKGEIANVGIRSPLAVSRSKVKGIQRARYRLNILDPGRDCQSRASYRLEEMPPWALRKHERRLVLGALFLERFLGAPFLGALEVQHDVAAASTRCNRNKAAARRNRDDKKLCSALRRGSIDADGAVRRSLRLEATSD